MASVAHVALDGHEANESIGGGARPRQAWSTNAVVVLTGVDMMSAMLLLFVACCVWCCDCRVVMPSGALSPSKMGAALSHEWAIADAVSKVVVIGGGCPSPLSGPERAAGDA